MPQNSPDPNKIRESFSRVKSDIFTLQSQILDLTREIQSLKRTLIQTDTQTHTPTHNQTQNATTIKSPLAPIIDTNTYPFNSISEVHAKHIFQDSQTDSSQNQTNPLFQQTEQTENMPQYGLKSQNSSSSTGNRGVPTDRQTHQQTDKSTLKRTLEPSLESLQSSKSQPELNELQVPNENTKPHKSYQEFNDDKIAHINRVSDIVNSLDTLKKDIRIMFKKLTSQEMLVYSTIYQLTDEGFIIDYSLIAEKTKLSESSIRDYVLKLTKKGVPLNKSKENNKRIILSIPQDFKKVASLSTINSLRDL